VHTDNEPAVEIVIDGHRLVDLVAEVEGPFATAAGLSTGSGRYQGPLRRWLNFPCVGPEHTMTRGWVFLLMCVCGDLACGPLNARVTVDDDRIPWSDFENPYHRRESKGGWWPYDALGPFVFDRYQYEREVRRLLAEPFGDEER
jgi:hypothetical protein